MPAQSVQKINYSLFPGLPLWYIPDSSPSKYFCRLFPCRYAHCVPDQISDHCEADYKLHLFQIVHYALFLSIHISPLLSSCFPEGICSEAAKSLCLRYRQYPVLSGETPLNWAMAAALNLLRALPLNPSKVLPPFAIQAQRTSSPLYSRQTKRNSCRCPFGMIFCSVCFSKILCIGFCENIKMGKTKGTNFLRLMPFPLLIHIFKCFLYVSFC